MCILNYANTIVSHMLILNVHYIYKNELIEVTLDIEMLGYHNYLECISIKTSLSYNIIIRIRTHLYSKEDDYHWDHHKQEEWC